MMSLFSARRIYDSSENIHAEKKLAISTPRQGEAILARESNISPADALLRGLPAGRLLQLIKAFPSCPPPRKICKRIFFPLS